MAIDDRPVPALDLRTYNPIHWRPETSQQAAALGRLDLLPLGTKADCVVRRRDPVRLRRFHHVVDVEAYHSDPATRAGTLVKLAAAGVVVHVPDARDRLDALLGPELHALTTIDPRGLDSGARELHSIRMRRAAMREHSSWARRSAELPTVSVLLATRRPAMLSQALAAVARQTYPRLQLSLALHGPDGAFAGAEEQVAALSVPARLVRVPSVASLGEVLNEATAAAAGTLLAKMDDDDLYDAEHVWDLVLAHAYSGAQVVGKGFEFAYLAASDRTFCQAGGHSEAYSTGFLAGGTLLIARDDLARVGGWGPRQAGVDTALISAVLRAAGSVYRTHGAGFMLVRHGVGHTWEAGDVHFLLNAKRIAPGCAPALAGIDTGATCPRE